MNFDESIGQSQQFPTQKPQTQKSDIEKVEEESEEQEEEQSSRVKDMSEEVDEESIVTSSKMISSSQAQVEPDGIHSSSEDKEVINSAKSVEWVITLDKQVDLLAESHRSNQYSDDFENLEEDYYEQSQPKSEKIPESVEEEEQEESEEEEEKDELDDLESCPDDIG